MYVTWICRKTLLQSAYVTLSPLTISQIVTVYCWTK